MLLASKEHSAFNPKHFRPFSTAQHAQCHRTKAPPVLSDGACIVLNASIVGSKGLPANSVYSATKAAVRSFQRRFRSGSREATQFLSLRMSEFLIEAPCSPDNVVFKANRTTAALPMPVVTEYGEGELPPPTITVRSRLYHFILGNR